MPANNTTSLQDNAGSSSAKVIGGGVGNVQRRPAGGIRRAPDNAVRERKPDFLCKVRYCNTLPDIPFESKFLSCPFVGLNRFIDYHQTSLEKTYKYELLTEPDLGVKIDLINPDTYHIDYRTEILKMHPLDERLLEDDQVNPQNFRRFTLFIVSKLITLCRSQQHNKIVPWMRKTEYISSEFNRLGTSNERQETKVGYSIKKKLESDNLYRDRASQIQAINKTFEEAAKPAHKHHSKPGVVAVEELELLPDFELWKYPFAQVIFDSDPAQHDARGKGEEMMSQALIRGMMDEQGEQFVAYFVPTEDTLRKRSKDHEEGRAFNPDENYEYHMIREYNWTVKNKASKGYEQENYFVILRNNGAFYNELETRVRLNRRRAKDGHAKVPNSRLIVRNRAETEQESSQQKQRVHSLMYPHEDEERRDVDKTAAAAAAGDVDESGVNDDDDDDEVVGNLGMDWTGRAADDDDDDDDDAVDNIPDDDDDDEP